MIRSLAFVAIAASASAQNVFPQDSILTAQEGTIEARSINGACVPAQSLRVALLWQALSLLMLTSTSIQPHKTDLPGFAAAVFGAAGALARCIPSPGHDGPGALGASFKRKGRVNDHTRR